jgi:hypothetical protein
MSNARLLAWIAACLVMSSASPASAKGAASHSWRADAGRYRSEVGRSCAYIVLSADLRLDRPIDLSVKDGSSADQSSLNSTLTDANR